MTDRKAYIRLAAEKAKTLNNGQMIRITPEDRYYIMRSPEGKLYIGQSLELDIKGKPFFPNREEFAQQRLSDKKIIGYWQKFMPTKGEMIAHGHYPGKGFKG